MNKITINDFKRMLEFAGKTVVARSEEFSKLDAITGDGDHGTAMESAFGAILSTNSASEDFKGLLSDMGFNVMMATSGSTSSLLGAFFLGMSDAASGSELTAEQAKAMFAGGLEGVEKQTKARVGDKTMMDALIPAVKAMSECESDDVAQILAAGAQAAQAGADATVEMQAAFGRARNYGERSIGAADSGAMSWASIFDSFAKALN